MYSDDFDIDLENLLPSKQEQQNFKPLKLNNKLDCYNDNVEGWFWNGKPIDKIPTSHKSFVYLFTNKINGKQYIGFKTAVSRTIKVVGGKKKRGEVESDWKDYYSSSQEVLHEIAKYGRGNFLREIIALTVDKSVGKYYEAYCQFTRNVLTSEHDRYYNGIVNLRLNHRTLKNFDKIEYASVILGDQLRNHLCKSIP